MICLGEISNCRYIRMICLGEISNCRYIRMMSRWDIKLQAQSYDLPPGHIILANTFVWCAARSHYSGKVNHFFYVELPFICWALDKGALTTNLTSLAWHDRVSNTGHLLDTKQLLFHEATSADGYLDICLASDLHS